MNGPPRSFNREPILPLMCRIPAASFLMGDRNGRDDEMPVHQVTLDEFKIAKYPVSNAEYAVFLKKTDHENPKAWSEPRFDRPDYPVCGVSWVDAVSYAQWLSDLTGEMYHLPTEAQREYATRGGHEQLSYPWGNDPIPLEGPYARGLSSPLTGGPITLGTPASHEPNGFGLYHMADNVHEWTADYYDEHYYERSPQRDPRGPQRSNRRAARGGSWRHDIKYCRCAARSSLGPFKRFTDFGFRLAASGAFEYLY